MALGLDRGEPGLRLRGQRGQPGPDIADSLQGLGNVLLGPPDPARRGQVVKMLSSQISTNLVPSPTVSWGAASGTPPMSAG